MKKREKILLTIFLIIVIGFLGQKGKSYFIVDTQHNLKEYGVNDIQALINMPKTEIAELFVIEGSPDVDFFYRRSKKIEIVMQEPELDEIIQGPNGYAAMISGIFFVEGDNVFDYLVEKIEENRVILSENGKKKILERK
jgi:hypothetical protein